MKMIVHVEWMTPLIVQKLKSLGKRKFAYKEEKGFYVSNCPIISKILLMH